jgi:amino acid adenylation domain-containing protein
MSGTWSDRKLAMSADPTSPAGFRLSLQQEHLWLLQREGPPLEARGTLALDGDLEPALLQAALGRVVARHEILRTGFQLLPGVAVPLQVIAGAPLPPVAHHDLSGVEPAARAAGLAEIWRGLTAEPLDCARPPLLAAALVALAADRHLLLLRLPALCADGATLGLLAGEIGRAYAAAAAGGELDGEPMQYVDFCEWQHEILESDDTAAGREHWTRQDLGARLAVRLPVQTTGESGEGRVAVALAPAQMATLGRLEAEGVRPEVFLLACWQALLGRLTGQSDVLVGVDFDGRKFAELREALGPFAQALAVRCRIDEKASFSTLLHQTEQAHREAMEWQESFTWRPWRGSAGAGEPDFPFAFAWAERPVGFVASGLALRLETWGAGAGRPEVGLYCLHGEGSLELAIGYDASRLAHVEAERLASRLEALIGNALVSPGAALGDLESLADKERDFLLGEINATATSFPADCIHTLLAQQAERSPEAWAVIAGEERLTYRELDERANRLARFLQARGVGPDVRVGICVGRSPEMLVGMLGILKAGGAYVPIDPSYPVERLAFMIDESNGPVVLTHERFREALAGYGRPLVCLDTDWREIGREEAAGPGTPVRPENLAYVIYTSGSTGRPKGVLVSHRNLVHSLTARLGYYRNRVESFLLLSSFAFDSSVAGIFGTLAQGGTLVLPEEDAQRDVPRLLELLDRHRISQLLSLPSLYSNLLDAAAEPGRLAALREVIVAGEACPPALIGRHHQRLPGAGLHNEYGPTEGTVWATVCELPPGGVEALIGRPIANAQVYLLNAALRPVMLGTPGELYIGGEGLARGYHDRPELTAERFIPHPFAGPVEAGSRLYRTGDLARFRPDGNLEFLGRVDQQVKIRGHRIELEEIEAVLGRHPRLLELAVVAREDEPGDLRLVAYVVPERGATLQVAELRAFVAASLPEPMVPALFVPLAALPLTPNGKVDRRALPAPGSVRSALQGAYVAPATLTEEVMAGLWSGVLGVEQVGTRDNFFDLGGHSLLATQLVSRLREAFQVDLTLLWLFETPTVHGLAARVEGALRQGAAVHDLPILRVDRGAELPLSFGQQRLWFLDQLAPGSPAYNVAKSFRITGPLHPAALERSLAEVVRRHEVLRTVFQSIDGRPVQVILPPSPHALPVVDLRRLAAEARHEEVRRLAAEEVARPFDLSRGPLLRSTLLLLAPQEFGVLFTLHHVVSDAWSMNLLVREMTVLYQAFVSGRPSPLPELEIQFADFAVWQRQRLHGEPLEAELAYWRGRLAGAPAVLDLPTDRPRPAVQRFRGGEVPFELPAAIHEAVKVLGRSQGATLFMVLLGAFQALLGRYSRQDDVAVGTPIAGRNRLETESLIGFFVNTLVLRGDLREEPSFHQLLRQVRTVSLEAHAHQDLPFEKLVEELAPERSLAHAPLFQVMFSLQHPRLEEVALADLRLGSLLAERNTVKFDVTLTMTGTPAGIRGVLGYNGDLFDATTAVRMSEHFAALVAAAAARPDEPVSGVPLMRSPERHQVEVEWNDAASAPEPETVIARFAAQAAKTPGAEALSFAFADESLTYGELNRRANRLAHHLRSLGVTTEHRVGLCVARSTQLVVAILAIFKAGGAYVPLDPSYPRRRHRLMLEDARVTVLVTESRLASGLEGIGTPVVCLDRDGEAIAARSDDDPPLAAAPSDLAYLIYTSGSTGSPKAVMVEQGQLANTLLGGLREFGWTAADRGLCLAPYSFDIFLFELLSPLLAGGAAVLFPLELGADVDRLAGLLPELTAIHAVPALMRQWVQAVRESPRRLDLSRLRTVFVGGDAVSSDLLVEMREVFSGAAIRVLYGPTEGTIICSSYRVPEAPEPIRSRIGRPLPNAVLSLRDEHGQPVAVGVPGEIHLGGAGVARGYWQREELTAERFVSLEGRRHYRTGDLARHLPDGTLEFLGRVDQQVKVRGFRIEPGEVEAALRTHPGVADAVVLALGESGADRRLVAYVVPAGTAGLAAELKAHLGGLLPEFMVPSSIVPLDELPLTPTGKVDRRKLSELERARVAPAERVAARTPVEETLAGIWREVLGLAELGVQEDFFALGGHSLLATQVVTRVRRALGKEVTLRLLFETRTVARMAAALERSPAAAPGLEPIRPVAPRVKDLDDLASELERLLLTDDQVVR